MPIWRDMNIQTRHYLTTLMTMWARSRGQDIVVPVALPEGVVGAEVCEILISHHIQVAMAPYLPVEAQTLEFRENLASSRERTAFLLMELERIVPAITWSDCNPVVLKGAALAPGYYAQTDQRWFLDLDILVPRNQVDEVCRRLEVVGYSLFSGDRDPLYYDRHHLHRMMVGPQGSCVEVHWDLTLPASTYRMDVNGVLNRAKVMVLGREKVLTASPADQILQGVYQNIADGFLDLKRILDLVLLVDGLSEEDSLYLVKEARQSKMHLALGLSLHLMKSLCGINYPGGIPHCLIPGWATNRILRGLDVELGMIERRAGKVDGYSSLMHLLMVPGRSKKLKESSRYLWGGEAELMDRGHWHDDLPGLAGRLRLSLYYLKIFLMQAGRATWALVRG